jgi:antitoxin (DNA-binding transcriptional repressor) of toxin-antitoxin stability system
MKTAAKVITAKEFHRNPAAILNAAKAGQSFQVTYHRKPSVKIEPIAKAKPATKAAPKRGTHAAFLESLKHIQPATGDLYDLSYKELRDRMLEEKYGKFRVR